MAQKAPKPSCYAAEEQVVDSTIPCCAGLQPMHEVGTRKVFCDQPPSSKGAVYMWSIILFFPLLLLVFAIFGIRNKMAQRKNNSNA